MTEVWFILLDGFDLFEAIAAMQVFVSTNEVLRQARGRAFYEIRAFSSGPSPVRCNGEMALRTNPLPSELAQPPDRLIVVGGNGVTRVAQSLSPCERRLVRWIARQHSRIGHLESIGSDAFVVVQSAIGLSLDATRSPDGEPAASSSGIELALRMVTQDEGHHIALQVAQRFAPSFDRIGAPFRFRSNLLGKACGDERASELNRWIVQHLKQPLTNERLASRLSMSPRTFARFYLNATGFTPARAVQRIRLEHACHAVETTLMSFKEIALRSGFSSEEVMRSVFVRVLGVNPSEYRQRFFGRV